MVCICAGFIFTNTYSSIVLLDEATSSIDFETDVKIQEVIRHEFNDALLLTSSHFILILYKTCLTAYIVAHRLRTVIDYDRLLVLDQGKVCMPLIFRYILSLTTDIRLLSLTHH